MTLYHPFDSFPRRPARLPPPESCDCQFHVFGNRERYPVRAGAAYEMPQATIAEAMKMHHALGIERGVIVQSTTYGIDHQVLLDALETAGRGYRGCAIGAVLAEADDGYISRLHNAGVRGARFNFMKQLNMNLSGAVFGRAVDRARELGWYVKVQPGKDGILDDAHLLEGIDLPVVIDHMGRPDLKQGVNGPVPAKVVELLKRGNFWVMLSNGHKLSKAGAPWDDVVPLARSYIEAAPDRVLWASDWPHPLSITPPPNDADLLELLFRYAPDEAVRKRILVDNPATLFGFE